MLKKLFNIFTQKDMDKVNHSHNEAIIDHVNNSYDLLEKNRTEYNDKISTLKSSIKTMEKEIELLHEDVAMALYNLDLPKRGIVIVTSPDFINDPVEGQIGYMKKATNRIEDNSAALSAKKMVKRLERVIRTFSADQVGRGGIDVLQCGVRKQLDFSSTSELKAILKSAKRGEFIILEQEGL